MLKTSKRVGEVTMGLTERHWFENEDVPENYEWALEDAVMSKEQESAPVPVPSYPVGYYGCGLSSESPEYKEDCYFYGETHDMGATVRFCTRGEIEWGHCPCEKCDRFLSKEEADKIIRSSINS